MSDEPTSDALTRASAYLDGELGASEIEAVEADTAVMAEVERLRSVQEEIRDLPGPSSYARDLAIDAALTEFDRIRQPAASTIRTKPRPSYGRWMAVAAAIAGVAALGAVITATARGGGSSDDAAGAEVAAEQSTLALEADDAARGASAGGASAAPQPQAADSQTMSVAAPSATTTAAAEASQQAAAATTFAPAATQSPATTVAAASGAPDRFDPARPIADDVELGRVGRLLLTEWRSGTLDSKVGTPCDGTIQSAVVLSDALVVVGGADRSVLIAADPQTEKAYALDPTSCVVLMTGR